MTWFKSMGLAIVVLLSACASAVESQRQPAPVVLMGEVHDNPVAHARRFDVVQQWVVQGWRPTILMEQFDRDTQAQLDEALARCDTAQCVFKQPWVQPWDWALYAPVLELALDHNLPIVAANVSRNDANAVVTKGYSAALDPNTIDQFNLNQPLPVDLQQAQQEAIESGHCNMLPATVAQKMVRAQVARDVFMAQLLIAQFNQGRPVLLIAGNGHVRRTVGVPRWLPASVLKNTRVYGFSETPDTRHAVEFDYFQQVPAHPRPDPCEAFKSFQSQQPSS